MSRRDQLPHLLKLMDDDSEVVRSGVFQALLEIGPDLEEEIGRLPDSLTPLQQEIVSRVMDVHNRTWLRENWMNWSLPSDEKERLEAGLTLLSAYQCRRKSQISLKQMLDQIADEFRAVHGYGDAFELADFLFKGKRLQGAQEDYYNPANSNLVYVIQEKKGIPISLACVYILTASRLDLPVEGCNMPGHFLSRVESEGKLYFVDGFYGGRVLTEKMVLAANTGSDPAVRQAVYSRADTPTILKRFLTNLSHAFEKSDQEADSRLMLDLMKRMDAHPPKNNIPDSPGEGGLE